MLTFPTLLNYLKKAKNQSKGIFQAKKEFIVSLKSRLMPAFVIMGALASLSPLWVAFPQNALGTNLASDFPEQPGVGLENDVRYVSLPYYIGLPLSRQEIQEVIQGIDKETSELKNAWLQNLDFAKKNLYPESIEKSLQEVQGMIRGFLVAKNEFTQNLNELKNISKLDKGELYNIIKSNAGDGATHSFQIVKNSIVEQLIAIHNLGRIEANKLYNDIINHPEYRKDHLVEEIKNFVKEIIEKNNYWIEYFSKWHSSFQDIESQYQSMIWQARIYQGARAAWFLGWNIANSMQEFARYIL